MKKMILKYKWSIVLLIGLGALNIFNPQIGAYANQLTVSNFMTMLSILPAIMILIGLLDVWVPKETMIRYMGEHSGPTGILIAFFLGSFAAGPLYAAFPIAAILLKKRAKFSNVLFFLGVWSTAKLPMVMYEFNSFGWKFTTIHILSNLSVFLIGAFVIEKIINSEERERIYTTAANLSLTN